MSILSDACVEYSVRDGVANFVGMTFTDRLGGKNIPAGHALQE